MKHFWTFVFIFCFPILAFADGIKLHEFTVNSSMAVLLVKILFINKNKNTIKVKVLQKFGNNAMSLSATSTEETEVCLHKDQDMVPGRWVSENIYWGRTKKYNVGDTVYLVQNSGCFDVTLYSPENIKKFDLIFGQGELAQKLSNMDIKTLFEHLNDRDLESGVLGELLNRKAFPVSELIKVQGLDRFIRFATIIYETFDVLEKKRFLIELANAFKNDPNRKIDDFYIFTRNLDIQNIESKLELVSITGLTSDGARQFFTAIQNQVKQQVTQKNYTLLPKIMPYYILSLKQADFSSPFSTDDFYLHLPEKDKDSFVFELANVFQLSPDPRFKKVFEYVYNQKHIEAAWVLTKINFKNLHHNDQSPFFNQILEILLSENYSGKLGLKEKLFQFTRPYIDYSNYPIKLEPENKKKYINLGGIIYSELPLLRVYTPNDSETLLEKFLYYYQQALLVELIQVQDKNTYPYARLKLVKKWGKLEPVKNNEITDAHKIWSEFQLETTLMVRLDSESLKSLKNFDGKKVILASKSKDYQFVLFLESSEKKIEDSFKNKI